MRERLRPGRPAPTALVPTVLAVVGVLALAGVVAYGVTHLGFLRAGHRSPFVAWTLIAWTVFAASVVALRFVPARWTAWLVVGGGLTASWSLIEPPLRNGVERGAPGLKGLPIVRSRDPEESVERGAAWFSQPGQARETARA